MTVINTAGRMSGNREQLKLLKFMYINIQNTCICEKTMPGLNVSSRMWAAVNKYFDANPNQLTLKKDTVIDGNTLPVTFEKFDNNIFAVANGETLGKGNSGRVRIAENAAGKLYALKDIYIDEEAESDIERGIIAKERDVLQHLDKMHGYKERTYLASKPRSLGEDSIEASGKIMLITDLARGVNLLSAVSNNLKQINSNPTQQKIVAAHILMEMIELHSRDVIHGDPKLENFMINFEGDQCIVAAVDFGSSAILAPGETECQVERAGTFEYMAPEMFEDEYELITVSKATDTYAVGTLLFEKMRIQDIPEIENLMTDDPEERLSLGSALLAIKGALEQCKEYSHSKSLQDFAKQISALAAKHEVNTYENISKSRPIKK